MSSHHDRWWYILMDNKLWMRIKIRRAHFCCTFCTYIHLLNGLKITDRSLLQMMLIPEFSRKLKYLTSNTTTKISYNRDAVIQLISYSLKLKKTEMMIYAKCIVHIFIQLFVVNIKIWLFSYTNNWIYNNKDTGRKKMLHS